MLGREADHTFEKVLTFTNLIILDLSKEFIWVKQVWNQGQYCQYLICFSLLILHQGPHNIEAEYSWSIS